MNNYNKILDNKTSLITGCNRGIGKSLVKNFAAAGSNIIACMRKENEDVYIIELQDSIEK